MKKIFLILLIVFGAAGYCFSAATKEAVVSTREAAKAPVPILITREAVISTREAAKASVPIIITPEAVPMRESAVKSQPVQLKFRDVPDDHWAASSVYDLVSMGVTQGYPDGTFRGNNNITRYETAMFLSKLANAVGKSGDEAEIAIEKLKDDIRADIRGLRADIAELKRMPEEQQEKPISGSYSASMTFGNLVAGNASVEGQTAPVGPLVRYRLKTTFTKSISETAKLKVNIDTMDSGFGGGSSDLSTRILDVAGDLQLYIGLENPVNVNVTSGPGPVVHTEEADANGNYIARSENGVVYMRPWNSIMFSSKVWGMDLGLGYIARKVSTFGEVEVNQVKTAIGYNFPGIYFFPTFKLNTNIDYLSNRPQANPPGPNDTKFTFDTSFMLSQKLKMGMLYSFGQGDAPHNSMYGMDFDLLDIWDSGTMLSFKYKKVGTQYLYENATLNEDLFAGLDVFNRYIGNGSGLGVVDIGTELTQVLTENVKIVGKSDWRLAADNSYDSDFPQCSLVLEGGVDWNLATDTVLNALYRVESMPAADDKSTDLTQISLSYKF